MPLVDQSAKYSYSGYELDDIERDQEPYFLAADVLERFFDGRDVLKPQPDWLEGQFHFEASAQELQYLVEESLRADGEEDAKVRFAANSASDIAWYLRTENATKEITRDRPIFVSLYEIDETVRIDGEARIIQALANLKRAERNLSSGRSDAAKCVCKAVGAGNVVLIFVWFAGRCVCPWADR